MPDVVEIATLIIGVIIIGLILRHGDASVNILRATGGFITAETAILGRD